MDKLIKYIETRAKRYGHVKSGQAMSSNYYEFSKGKVRISDHLKYGMGDQNTFDYSFIIQENDVYIFSVSAKHNVKNMNKMYLKIVTLEEAKQFIKKLHDFSITFDNMSEVFKPKGWNTGNVKSNNKQSWEDFCEMYIDIHTEDCKKLHVLDMIEKIRTGVNSKGGVADKMSRMSETYETLNMTQYETLINKLNK